MAATLGKSEDGRDLSLRASVRPKQQMRSIVSRMPAVKPEKKPTRMAVGGKGSLLDDVGLEPLLEAAAVPPGVIVATDVGAELEDETADEVACVEPVFGIEVGAAPDADELLEGLLTAQIWFPFASFVHE